MDITRSARGDSLSQGLELGCYEPSAHDRQAFTDSAEVGGWRGPWKAMRWASCVDISGSVDCDAVNRLSDKS
jgi:hypothetical protein